MIGGKGPSRRAVFGGLVGALAVTSANANVLLKGAGKAGPPPVPGAGDLIGLEVLGASAIAATAPIQNIDPNGWVLKATFKGMLINQAIDKSKWQINISSPGYNGTTPTTVPRSVGVLLGLRNPIPPNWTTGEVVAPGTRRMTVTSGNSAAYITAAGGTCGATAPTGTGASINDGGVIWSYLATVNDVTPLYQEQVGADAVIYLAASDFIHPGDVCTSLVISAGAYGSSNAANPAFVTFANNSTLAQIIPSVAEMTQPWQIVTTTIRAELAVHHPFGQQRRTVSAVQWRVLDSTGAVVLTPSAITSMGRSQIATLTGNKIQNFGQDINISGLSDGLYYLEYSAYPFRGAAFVSTTHGYGATLPVAASNITVNNSKLIPFRKDASGAYGQVHVYVDLATGNNTTGQASTNQATAAGLPFATVDAAFATATRGAQAVCNSALGRNNYGNVVCYLRAGTYTDTFGAGGNLPGRTKGDVWARITRDPATTTFPSDVILQPSATVANKQGLRRVKYESIRIEANSGAAALDNISTGTGEFLFEQWFEGCEIAGAATGTQRPLFRMGLSWFTNCAVNMWASATNMDNKSNIKLAAACTFVGSGVGGTNNTCSVGAANTLGCVFTGGAGPVNSSNVVGFEGTGAVVPLQTSMWMFNSWPSCIATPRQFNSTSLAGCLGRAGVWSQNFVEVFSSGGNGSSKSGELSADSVVFPIPWLFHDWNSYPGEGINLCYNENGTTPTANVAKRCLSSYNVAGDYNIKGDWYDSAPVDWSQYRVGNFAFRHGVGCHSNYVYSPTNTVPGPLNLMGESWAADWRIGGGRGPVVGPGLGGGEDPKFVNDQSFYAPAGPYAGGGNYRGTSISPHKSMVSAVEGFYPEDLYGLTRQTVDTPGAFTWQ